MNRINGILLLGAYTSVVLTIFGVVTVVNIGNINRFVVSYYETLDQLGGIIDTVNDIKGDIEEFKDIITF